MIAAALLSGQRREASQPMNPHPLPRHPEFPVAYPLKGGGRVSEGRDLPNGEAVVVGLKIHTRMYRRLCTGRG